jgi:hypothetical protein
MKDQRRARPSQPSARKNAPGPVFIRFPDVTLTSEEQEECDVLVSSVFRADEQGYWALHEGAAEPITRNLIAMCLMSRAERLAWDADDNVEARADVHAHRRGAVDLQRERAAVELARLRDESRP